MSAGDSLEVATLSVGHKPWRLDYDSVPTGDAAPIRNWFNTIFNWLRNTNRDTIFDFRKSQWSWTPNKNKQGGIGTFLHPQSLDDLKNCKDTERFPYYFVEGTKSEPVESKLDSSTSKTEPPEEKRAETISSDSVKCKIYNRNDIEITADEERWSAVIRTISGYTNDDSIAAAAANKFNIKADNAHDLYGGDFISSFEDHLRRGAFQLEPYVPKPYEYGMSNALWLSASQLLHILFTDCGIDVSKTEQSEVPALELLESWQLIANSHNFNQSRTLVQMRTIQNRIMNLFGNYKDCPLDIDLFNPNSSKFDGEDSLTPILAFVLFAATTSDISLADKRHLVQDLASNRKVNECDLTMKDFMEEKNWIFNRIDSIRQRRLTSGAILSTFDMSKFRANLLNAKNKEKTANFNRNQVNRNGKPPDSPIKKTDTFGFANPHRFLPVYRDHPINNLDRNKDNRDNRDNNRDRRDKDNRTKSSRPSDNRSDNRNRDRNNRSYSRRSRDSRDSRRRDSSRNRRSSRDRGRSSRSNYSSRSDHSRRSGGRSYRHVDQDKDRSADRDSRNDNDHDERKSPEGDFNQSDSRSNDSQGKVDSKNFNEYNRLTTAVFRRIN